MKRNWGLSAKDGQSAIRDAKISKPVLTLIMSAVFGVIAASVAAISFSVAADRIANLFHGLSLIAAVLSAGFGCWSYIWLARPRFAAQFTGKGDAFSILLRFYAKAALALCVILMLGYQAGLLASNHISVLLLCLSGGAGAAAAFQTVLTFVPYYE